MADPAVWAFVLTGLVMAALAYGATRFAGRLLHPGRTGRTLQVIEALPLGRDRALYLVRVGTELLVIGSAPGGITRIHSADPEVLQTSPAGAPEPFSHWLTRLSGLKRPEQRRGGEGNA